MSFGVYVHIPFCAHRCDYCDFATWTDRAHLIDDYVGACVADEGAVPRDRGVLAFARIQEHTQRFRSTIRDAEGRGTVVGGSAEPAYLTGDETLAGGSV